MSRIGMMPIEIPDGAKVAVEGRFFRAEGPKGKVSEPIAAGIEVAIEDGQVKVTRPDDSNRARAMHGLTRALLANAVKGVSEGFMKELELVGVGYRAEVSGKTVNFRLGYSHPVEYPIPEGISVEVDRSNVISIRGASRQQVGQVAAEIRKLRKPDAYKGKGFRYKGEQLRLKVGKAGVTA
ncbi:MAG: 50S ribosomal protein L6 [Myxococcota bacterium]